MGIGKRVGFMKPQTLLSGSRPTLQERFKEITWEERNDADLVTWRNEDLKWYVCEEILEKDIGSLRKILPQNNFSEGN